MTTATLEYLGLEEDEFQEYFAELDETDKTLCSSLLKGLPDPEKKKVIYDMLGLVSDEEIEDILNNWEPILSSL